MGEAFQKTFRFTGGEIVNEFLMSTGYFPAHILQIAWFLKRYKDQNHLDERPEKLTTIIALFYMHRFESKFSLEVDNQVYISRCLPSNKSLLVTDFFPK
jgi:hypothetical protein